MQTKQKPIFTEHIKLFRKKGFLIWLSVGVLFGILLYYKITDTQELSEETKPLLIGIISAVLIILILIASLVAYFLIRLKTEINNEFIKVTYIRVIEKTIPWNQVASAAIVTLKIVGNRLATGWENYGASKNNKGSNALALELKNGKKILIGTEKATELNQLIEQIPVAGKNYNSIWFYSTPKHKL